jgi:hypothetical protein
MVKPARRKSKQVVLPLDLPRLRHVSVLMTDAEWRALRSRCALAGVSLVTHLSDMTRKSL